MSDDNLRRLVHEPSAALDSIADVLERVSHEQRLTAVRSLGRKDQRALFHKADARDVQLADFVPDDRMPLEPVRHYGCNTLPIPGQRLFEKRFCRPSGNGRRLFGYNEAPSRFLVGPGYFVVVPTEGHPEWVERGAVVVDYFQVPDGPVAAGWPAVVPNDHGLQRFVYHQTRDFMRRVSQHVTIGAAYKRERSLDHYFVLVRQP
jgi:hypothetical protein